MRICFITTGDIESLATIKRATGMAEPLAERGHSVCIVAWDTKNNRERFALEAPRAEIVWIAPGLPGWKERMLKLRLARQWGPDIVFVCAFGIRNSVTRFETGAARVVVEHSELASGIPRSFASRQKERAMEWLSVLASDGLLCASGFLCEHFSRIAVRTGRRSLPLVYHPYAYNPDTLRCDNALLPAVVHAKGDRKLLLYMGTLAINYGILDLLKGIKRLSAKRSDFVFHVFGRGRHADRARQVAQEMGLGAVVQFDGYVPEEALGTWFSCADVFLAPIYDTVQDKARCPSKVYMYLPFEVPIVTSRIGDPCQLLGEDAFYYEPGDFDGLAAAIDRALDRPESWTPRSVRAADHTWDQRTQQFLEWAGRLVGTEV